ncbi:MAG TPA: STAS domain-containing protein [Chthoniobacteraceae bacterium]|jgi:anti-sigma B factor antagonist|nr:STAS domain-containing protein [Chthoniobacteraceae bacterium]
MAAAAQNQTGILALEGEIDLHRSPEVKQTLQPLLEKKLPRIFIDMSKVQYIDSSGLALFIETLQRVGTYGGKFALFGLRESVRSIFEIARLDQVFQIYSDEASAQSAV